MQWQMWSRYYNFSFIFQMTNTSIAAFGIMLGYVADLAFYGVNVSGVTGLNWRLMMGSACFPAIIVFSFVFLCPESPRWYMQKGRHAKAYESMCKLRYSPTPRTCSVVLRTGHVRKCLPT